LENVPGADRRRGAFASSSGAQPVEIAMMSISIGHRTALDLLHACCPPGGLVVDAGAFPGTLTRLLKQHGWNVLALDKEPERGVSLQQRFKTGESRKSGDTDNETTFAETMRQIGVEVRSVDLETEGYPIDSGSVDAVMLTEVIEHLWVDPLFALTEMNRILKGGTGILLLSTPNLLSLRNRVNFLRGRMTRVIEHPFVAFLKKSRLGHVGHIRLYAPAELETILRLLGFDPCFHFYSFDYWEQVANGSSSDGKPDQKAESREASTSPLPPPSRHYLRKLFRSPRGYLDAAVATFRTGLEKLVPSYRPHVFVVARKVRDADYRDVSMNEVLSAIEGKVRQEIANVGQNGAVLLAENP
jgi:SAM-dependent methyltransferase